MDETLKRFEEGLLAAEKAGDVAAAKEIAAEMRVYMQRSNPSIGQPEPVKLGQEGMPSAIRSVAKERFGPVGQAFAGAGAAPVLAGQGLAGLVGMENPETIANWRAIQGATPYTMGGNLAGNIGMFAAAPTQIGASGLRAIASGLGMKAPAMIASRPWMVTDTILSSGILNAATEPGSTRDRLIAGGLGMGTSAIAPTLYAVGASGRRMVTRGGKRVSVGEGLKAELGDEGTDKLAAQLTGPDRAESLLGVRSSSAMRSGEPTLEALETGSRVQRGDLWRAFDQDNATARWKAMLNKAGTPDDLSNLKAERSASTSALRSDALTDAQTIAGMAWPGAHLKGLFDKVDELRMGKARPNPDAQKLADYVEGQLKQGVSPEQLYEVRKFLTDGVKAGRTDELSNAVKAARVERMDIVGRIDDVLNEMSGGQWGDYLSSYAHKSLPINSKQALQDMVRALEHGQPTGTVPAAMTNSWYRVGSLRDALGKKEIGGRIFDRLMPEDREFINAMVDNLKRQQDVMGSKAVVGSHTAPLLANASRAANITQGVLSAKVPGSGILTSAAFDKLGRKAEEELARLLQDPPALLEALRAAERAERLRKGFSRAGAGSGAAGSEYQR